jgi:hypothetical protein
MLLCYRYGHGEGGFAIHLIEIPLRGYRSERELIGSKPRMIQLTAMLRQYVVDVRGPIDRTYNLKLGHFAEAKRL